MLLELLELMVASLNQTARPMLIVKLYYHRWRHVISLLTTSKKCVVLLTVLVAELIDSVDCTSIFQIRNLYTRTQPIFLAQVFNTLKELAVLLMAQNTMMIQWTR